MTATKKLDDKQDEPETAGTLIHQLTCLLTVDGTVVLNHRLQATQPLHWDVSRTKEATIITLFN